MKTILTIGFSHYLVTSQAAALGVLKGLTCSTPVERSYDTKTKRYVYTPSQRHDERNISVELVTPEQVKMDKKPRLPKGPTEETL